MKPPTDTSKTPWYVRAFNADYLARYKHRSDALARTELPFVVSALNLQAGSTVLDLCCGAGRHSRGLIAAMTGGRVIGLDLSADLLHDAQSKNRSKKRLFFVRADMRKIPLASRQFDAAVNLFTSFGYFKTDREHLSVLQEVARILRPGGRFVMDFFNREHVLATLVKRSESDANGCHILETRRFDTRSQRIIKNIRMTECADKSEVFKESIRAYSPAELKALLKSAGLEPLSQHGDLSGAPFQAKSSPRCVFVCRRASAI